MKSHRVQSCCDAAEQKQWRGREYGLLNIRLYATCIQFILAHIAHTHTLRAAEYTKQKQCLAV